MQGCPIGVQWYGDDADGGYLGCVMVITWKTRSSMMFNHHLIVICDDRPIFFVMCEHFIDYTV